MIIVGALLMWSAAAQALEQPNGATIPSEMGCDSGSPTGLAAVFACQCDGPGCNIGPVCQSEGNCPPPPSGNCETTLWHSFNDNTCIPSNRSGLDPWTDGALVPERYMPTCALTFTVVSRGTAIFGDIFGWYNVTGSKPELSDLHPMLGCDAAEGESVVLDVRGDPAYLGGEIGFFIATPEGPGKQCAGGDCCASLARVAAGEGNVFYSERSYNPDASGANSIVHLVVFDSRISEHKFYFAWEDIFGGSNNDFTDLVTSVEGVECSEGGAACDTGLEGICAHGILTCSSAGTECLQLYQEREELCDGADNDCDGEVDEDGVCTDDVVGGCEGITCPEGQICRYGTCSELCAHVQCAAGETCRGGACFPGCNQCNGVVCRSDETCDLGSGNCLTGGENPGTDGGVGFDGDAGVGGPAAATGCECEAGGRGLPGGGVLLFALLAVSIATRRRRRV